MVVTLSDAGFFLAGIVATVLVSGPVFRLLLREEYSIGFRTGVKEGGCDRRTALRKAIDYLGTGTDPEATIACAKAFESYLDGIHVKSASRSAKVAR